MLNVTSAHFAVVESAVSTAEGVFLEDTYRGKQGLARGVECQGVLLLALPVLQDCVGVLFFVIGCCSFQNTSYAYIHTSSQSSGGMLIVYVHMLLEQQLLMKVGGHWAAPCIFTVCVMDSCRTVHMRCCPQYHTAV
jgi:hypothetical protein